MSKIVFYIILFFIGFVSIIAATYLYFMEYPNVCKYGCQLAPSYLKGPNCASVIEKFKDNSIPAPSPLIYLSNFSLSRGAGPPFCAPTWYAFRYVKNSNGAYGPLSKWSGSGTLTGDVQIPLPIYSGGENLPCPPPGCSQSKIPFGKSTCSFNQPEISLAGPLDIDYTYGDPNSYTLNVHRQTGDGFDKNGAPKGFDMMSEGDIVGSFIVTPKKIFFIDVFSNPHTTTGTSCC